MASLFTPMCSKHSKEFIQKNLSTLSTTTANFDQVVGRLYGFGCLSIDEKEVLEGKPTTFTKFSSLYCLLNSKHHRAFAQLIITLALTQNEAALELLVGKTADQLEEQGITQFVNPADVIVEVVKDNGNYRSIVLVNSHRTVSQDFQVQDVHVNRICDILKKSQLLSNNRDTFIAQLLDPNDWQNLKNVPKHYGSDVIICETLMRWTKSRGKMATFEGLIQLLERGRFEDAAVSLRSAKGKIENAFMQ